MKKLLMALLTIGLFFGIFTSNVFAAKTVHCYKSVLNGNLVYTADQGEATVLDTHPHFKYMGESWIAPDSGQPVYRLYNPELNLHHYTVNPDEVLFLSTEHGWIPDFDGRPAFYSGGPDSVWRLYDSESGVHILTAEQDEVDRYLLNKKIVFEGRAITGFSLANKQYSGLK